MLSGKTQTSWLRSSRAPYGKSERIRLSGHTAGLAFRGVACSGGALWAFSPRRHSFRLGMQGLGMQGPPVRTPPLASEFHFTTCTPDQRCPIHSLRGDPSISDRVEFVSWEFEKPLCAALWRWLLALQEFCALVVKRSRY